MMFLGHVAPPIRNDVNIDGFSVSNFDKIDIHALDQSHIDIIKYEKTKTKGRRLFSRKDIIPKELSKHLPSFCIFDLVYNENSLDDIILRLIGTEVAELYGEITGQSYRTIEHEVASQRLFLAVSRVVETKNLVFIRGETPSELEKFINVSAILLPLSNDNNRITQVLAHFKITKNISS